ncbi:MAG: bifunctional phosphopantothenoylcysteine decarboxylase/phosphopantothenate--cysteine ligase CoaBC [Planctomycetota bacterium]
MTTKRIVIGVCGGIACYKVCDVVSLLYQRGFDVTVIMTAAAQKFVKPFTFQTLSHKKVYTDLFDETQHDPSHIYLADNADLFLIAPATADIIAKLSIGIADDLLSTCALALKAPLMIAPSMNDNMWNHPTVKANLATLGSRGAFCVAPDVGYLACDRVGTGRLPAPDAIVAAVEKLLGPGPGRAFPAGK